MSSSSYQKYFQNLLSILLTSLVFGLLGCSNGGGETSSSSKNIISYKLSGKVQKGQFLDGTIIATKLEDNGSLDITHTSKAFITEDGEYAVSINWNGPTFLQAEGHYFDEYSDINSSQNIILEALTDVNSTQNININLLSSLEANRVLELLKTDTNFSAIQSLAKENLEQIFSHPKDISTVDLDMFDFNSSFSDANKNLLLLSALFLKVTQEDEILSSSSIARAPNLGGKKSLSLSKLKSDFSKNGKVDTVFKAKWEKIIEEDIVAVAEKVSKNIDIEVVYVTPPTHWSKRLQLSVSTPQYIFDGSKLKKIIYDVSIPLANYTDRSRVYNLSYSTSDNSAKAGSEYTSTSGDFSFSFTHNSAKITIDVLTQSSDTKTFNLNFIATTEGLTITNPKLEVEIFQNTISLAARPSILSLSLDSIDVDGLSSSISSSSSVVFVGNSTSRVNLGISIEASTSRPAEYFADIFVTASGQTPLKLAKVFMSTLGDVGGRAFYQGADLTVELDSALKGYLQTAYANNEEVKLFAEVLIDESSSTTLSSYALPKLVQVSTSLSSNVEISTFEYLEALDSSCNSTSQSGFDASTLYAEVNMYGLFSASYLSAPIGIEYDGVCVKMEYDLVKKEYGLTLESGEGVLDTDMQVEVYGNNLILSEPKVSNTSITPQAITMLLPKGHTLHKRDFLNNISPRGEKSFTFTPSKLNISDDLSLVTYTGEFPQESYLHGKNLPFYLKLNKVRLDASGLSFESLEREYVFGYSNAIRNNTDRFKKPKNGSFSFSLDSQGISSSNSLSFDTTSLKTQFPKAEISLKIFSIKVDKSEIQTSSKNVSETYSTEYQQNCKNNECGSAAKYTSISFNTSNTRLYKDGSSVSTKADEAVSVAWGEKGLSSVYKREHDKGVSIYIPGFILPTNDVTKVGEYLYGSVKSTSSKLYTYGSRTNQAKSGEYLYAGVNVGELSHSNEVSIKTPDMSVVLGLNTTLTLQNTQDTKYYIRSSGITGVFNNTNSVLQTSLYGYDMNLKSFKFRQISNKIDEYTKIEGDVHVPGLGDFDVAFKSLSIDCSGNFRGGSINPEQSEILLKTWKMNSKLTNIAFKNRDNDVCSSRKTLWLGHLLKVAALKNSVELGTYWESGGSPRETVLLADTYNQLDGKASLDAEEDNGGYDIAIKDITFNFADSGSGGDISSAKRAWIATDAKIGLPFWGGQDMSIRMTNETPQTRDFSVVTKEGELYGGERTRFLSNKELAIDVRTNYDQNITRDIFNVIDFSLPAHYNAISTSKTPIFVGTPYVKDLIVFKINANIDKITPEKTKISLGASADLSVLKDPQLHIDLTDPESLSNIDANISYFFPSSGAPFQDSLGGVFEINQKISEIINETYTSSIEVPFYLALKTTALLDENDPYERMAKATAKILNAIPPLLEKFDKEFYQELMKTFDENEKFTSDVARRLHLAVEARQALIIITDRHIEDLQHIPDFEKAGDLLPKIRIKIYKYAIGTTEEKCSLENILEVQTETYDEINKKIVVQNKFLNSIKYSVDLAKKLKNYDVDAAIDKLTFLNYVGGLNAEVKARVHTRLDSVKEMIIAMEPEKIDAAYEKTKNWVDNDFCPRLDDALDDIKELNATLVRIDDQKRRVITELQKFQIALYDSELGEYISIIDNINEDSNMTQLKEKLTDIYERKMSANLQKMAQVSKKLPRLSADEYRMLTVYAVMQLDVMQELDRKVREKMQPKIDKIQELVLHIFAVYDSILNDVLGAVSDKLNKAIEKSSARFSKIPIDAAGMDGYAVVGEDEIHRVHITASFTVASDENSTNEDENSTTSSDEESSGGSFGGGEDTNPAKKNDDKDMQFSANLDMVNEAYEGSSGCKGDSENSNMRVSISTEEISMKLAKRKLAVDYLELGVVLGKNELDLESRKPELKGLFGAISSQDGMEFEKFKLYDMGLALGVGGSEQFLGAKVSANIETVQFGMSFLVGNVCNKKIIDSLVPESIEEYVTIPQNHFKGYLVYGEGQMPIYASPDGKTISLGLRAKLGVWSLDGPPLTQGGLIGGGVFGKVTSLYVSGNLMALREKSGGVVRYVGDGWTAGSIGKRCNPATWQSFDDILEDEKGCIKYGAGFTVVRQKNENGKKTKLKLSNFVTKPELPFLQGDN